MRKGRVNFSPSLSPSLSLSLSFSLSLSLVWLKERRRIGAFISIARCKHIMIIAQCKNAIYLLSKNKRMPLPFRALSLTSPVLLPSYLSRRCHLRHVAHDSKSKVSRVRSSVIDASDRFKIFAPLFIENFTKMQEKYDMKDKLRET